ncbi:MAG: sensor histidine kinase, partial [Emergencia sp.]
ITLTVNCEEDLVFMTNQESLKHILINLIQNAVDAITVTPGRVIITAELIDTGRLELKVKDNGCGIKKEDMASLFNPFFTTKEPGKGTGLGLYIVYSEIENIGGTIEVESEEGRGACFTIRLPEIENEVKKA